MHGIDQAQPFMDPAFTQYVFHLSSDVDEASPLGDVEPEFSSV